MRCNHITRADFVDMAAAAAAAVAVAGCTSGANTASSVQHL